MTKKYHSIPEEWIAQVIEDYNKLYQGDNESALYVLNRIKEYFPAVEDKQELLKDRIFQLANDFAIDKQGDIAVALHAIHNTINPS